MKQYNIYIGLSDPVTRRQMFDTDKYVMIVKNVCKSYHVRFSFSIMQGGYLSDEGDIVDETTLHISLLDLPEKTVNEIAQDLCTFFHQNSVMITREQVVMHYIKGDRKVQEEMSILRQKDVSSEGEKL